MCANRFARDLGVCTSMQNGHQIDVSYIYIYIFARHFSCHTSPKLPLHSDLPMYKAVLVIPDIYNRNHLRELMSLLLIKIGFGSCFFVQDHVAATFGAGLGYACVVDVGDQKTSVSCVEDGISHPNTRVRLEYGGADVTQTLHWLLKKCAFPYSKCDERRPQDAMLLKSLKEDFCHVNLVTYTIILCVNCRKCVGNL